MAFPVSGLVAIHAEAPRSASDDAGNLFREAFLFCAAGIGGMFVGSWFMVERRLIAISILEVERCPGNTVARYRVDLPHVQHARAGVEVVEDDGRYHRFHGLVAEVLRV